MIHCYLCYARTEEDFCCDTCDQYYCEDCSYHFTLHYQFQGARCHHCADQYHRKVTKEEIRDNKLKLIEYSRDEKIKQIIDNDV